MSLPISLPFCPFSAQICPFVYFSVVQTFYFLIYIKKYVIKHIFEPIFACQVIKRPYFCVVKHEINEISQDNKINLGG